MRFLFWISIFIAVISLSRCPGASPIPPLRKVYSESAQLHRLDPKRIPDAERRPWHPAELAAVLGSQYGRHWNHLDAVSYSSDGKRIATLSNGQVTIWETPNLRFRGVLPIKTGFMQFPPERRELLICGEDGIAQLWNVNGDIPRSRDIQRKILGFPSSDGKRLAVSTQQGIKIINTQFSPPKDWEVPLAEGRSLLESAFSHDTRFLVTETAKVDYSCLGFLRDPWITDVKLTLWDVTATTPKVHCVLPLTGSYAAHKRFAFSPDDKTLVWGGHVWDLSGNKPKFRSAMNEKDHSIEDCIFLPATQHAITTDCACPKYFLQLRDMQPHVPRVLQTVELSSYYSGMALSPDAKTLAVGEGNCLRLWPLKEGKIEKPSPTYGHTQAVRALSFGACGNLLATSGEDRSLRLWDLDGLRPHQRLVHPRETPPWETVALSPDGTKVAAGFKNGGFSLWAISPSGLRLLAEHKCGGDYLLFSPDSKTLFSSVFLGPVNVIDVSKPTEALTSLAVRQSGEGSRVEALAVSPDGQKLAVGGRGGFKVELWQRTEGDWQKQTDFPAHGQVKSLSFGGRGNLLMVGGGCYRNPEVNLFDVSGDKPTHLTTLTGLRDVALSVTASSGGHLFAATDETGRVVVWSATGKKLHEWTFPGPVRCVAFAPDGYHLALGNGDGTVYILRLAKAKEKP